MYLTRNNEQVSDVLDRILAEIYLKLHYFCYKISQLPSAGSKLTIDIKELSNFSVPLNISSCHTRSVNLAQTTKT